jgi:hypothetical protein
VAPEARQALVTDEADEALDPVRRLSARLGELLARVARRPLLAAAGAALALTGAYLLGGLRGGDDGFADEVAERHLRRQLTLLKEENRKVTEQLARLRTDQRVDREAYTRVEEQLAELQGKIIEQQEELAFYRGIVGGPGQAGLRIQDFAVSGRPAGGFRLHFILAQVRQVEREVRGQMQVRVEGTRAGRHVSMDVASLAASADGPRLSFAFRYFQDIAMDLKLPADFTPQRVVIRILPTTRGVQASVESFPWTVRPS